MIDHDEAARRSMFGEAAADAQAVEPDLRVADAAEGNWVDDGAPRFMRPYLRLMRADRPIGWQLLLLPGWQGLALAGTAAEWKASDLATAGWLVLAWLFFAFLLGSIVMRGAGCVLNDIVDRDIDAQVERTRSRPLPSGQASLRGAVLLLAILCAVGLFILSTLNDDAIVVGLAAALPVIVYPFMKRITWWPQLFLGIAFGWGALLGWSALAGPLDWPAAALYLSSIFWIVGYDTIYAHQDREDDALVGVKSTARLFGGATRPALAALYALAVVWAGIAGALAGVGWLFWVGLGGYALHLAAQIARLDIDDPDRCLRLFKSNWDAGLLLFFAILIGAL